MPQIQFRASRKPRKAERAKAAAVFIAFILIALAQVTAFGDQPFKLESESGDVIDFQGNVHAEGAGAASSDVQPILPLPVKQRPSIDTKPQATEADKTVPKEAKPQAREFKRARPSVIKKTAPVKESQPEEKPEIEILPEKSEEVKGDRETGIDTDAGADEATVENNKLERNETAEAAENKASTEPANVAAPPLSLMRGVNFSLSSEGIEYNWRTKALRAKSGFYSQNGIAIIADEIRIDLHNGILSASGNVTLYFGATLAMKGQNYEGNLLLYNMKTMEAAVETDSGTSYLSPVETASSSGLPDDGYIGSISLYPAAAAPSLDGMGIVEYSDGADTDAIKASRMSFSESDGVTFTGASYRKSGKDYFVPSFHTASGELTQKNFAVNALTAYYTPSSSSNSFTGTSAYYLNDNPMRTAVLRDSELLSYSSAKSKFNNMFSRDFTKMSVFGNNILSFGFSTQKTDFTSVAASYKRYWFPDRKTVMNFSYEKKFTGLYSSSGLPVEDDYDTVNLALSRNSRLFTISASAFSEKGLYDYTNNFIHSGNTTYYYSDLSYSANMLNFTLYAKPVPIAKRRLFFCNYFNYSQNSTSGNEVNSIFFSLYPPWQYTQKNRYIDFKTGLSSGRVKLAPRVYAAARTEYETYNSKYSFTYYNGRNYRTQQSKTDEARGIAGLDWRFSKKGVAGADYVWNRKGRSGYSVITPYLSYAGSERWNVRATGRYHEEMSGNNVGPGEKLRSETLDLSMRFGKRSTLQASWDLDNVIHGVTLYSLDLKSESWRGQSVFSVSKYTTASYYVTNTTLTTIYSTPYRYSLSFYPK